MKVVAIIQARMGSIRLPKKVLKELNHCPMIKCIVSRVSRGKMLDETVVATSTEVSDDPLCEFCASNGIPYTRGSLDNVLERFYQTAKAYHADIIVRLTGDNALVDNTIIDGAVKYFIERNRTVKLDYLKYKEKLPLGMACEVMSFAALQKAFSEAKDAQCLEHVTPYLYRNPQLFNSESFVEPGDGDDYSSFRWTMDSEEDYKLVSSIYDYFGTFEFSYEDILEAYSIHPEWKSINHCMQQKIVTYQGEKAGQ